MYHMVLHSQALEICLPRNKSPDVVVLGCLPCKPTFSSPICLPNIHTNKSPPLLNSFVLHLTSILPVTFFFRIPPSFHSFSTLMYIRVLILWLGCKQPEKQSTCNKSRALCLYNLGSYAALPGYLVSL